MEPSGLFVRSCENLFQQIWFAAGLWSLPQEVAAVLGLWSFKWHQWKQWQFTSHLSGEECCHCWESMEYLKKVGLLLNHQQQPNFSFIVMDGSSTLQLMYIVQPWWGSGLHFERLKRRWVISVTGLTSCRYVTLWLALQYWSFKLASCPSVCCSWRVAAAMSNCPVCRDLSAGVPHKKSISLQVRRGCNS